MSKVDHNERCPNCASRNLDTHGDNLIVYIDGGYHCFSCGYHSSGKFKFPEPPKEQVDKERLPFDFTREIPSSALQWLLQYGLPYSYWKPHLGYSLWYSRLVFTIGDPLQFSIGRYVGNDLKKKWYVWGNSHKHCEVIGEGNTVVLVEDIVSAHKVGQVTSSIPLFGTEIHPCHLYYLINTNKKVILWLDKDQEFNIKGKILRLETLLGQRVEYIITNKDPKYLSVPEIKNYIGW